MKKTFLHITNTDPAKDSRIQKELVALSKLDGAKIVALGVSETGAQGADLIGETIVIYIGLFARNMRFMPRPIRYFFELIEFTCRAVLQGRRVNPEVIHCHDTFALPTGWILKLLANGKLVYDAHELESNKNGQNIILSQATLAIEHFCWKKIDLLVSVSESILHWYEKNLGPKETVLVLNSPVYESIKIVKSARKEENYFVQKYNIPKSSLIFVYLGILAPGRGIEACLEAFKEIDERAQLIFIGFGKLEKLIEDASKAYSNIHFHPAVKHHEVVPLVANADYGLCFIENASLSDYLCLPNKLFEYTFAGLKILASNFPEIESTVKTFELGTCCDPTTKEITAVVSSILDSPLTCTTRDVSELSWERQAQRLVMAYSHMLSKPHVNH